MSKNTLTLRRVVRAIGRYWPMMLASLLLAAVSVALTL